MVLRIGTGIEQDYCSRCTAGIVGDEQTFTTIGCVLAWLLIAMGDYVC